MEEQLFGLTAEDVSRLHTLLREFESGALHDRPRHRAARLPWRYPSSSAIRFELTETLTLGGEADALKVRWNGSSYETTGDPIVVKDYTESPGAWWGSVGYHGWAVLPDTNDDDKYEIIWMETLARYIEFTSAEDMGATTAEQMEVTVNRYWNIKDPGSTVIVHDPGALFPRAKDGAEGVAIYDERRDLYELIECKTKAGWVRSTLTASMASNESDAATYGDHGGSQQDIMSPGPTVDLKDKDTFFRRALTGAKTFSLYDQVLDEYLVIQSESKAGALEFTLNNAFSTGASSGATVNRYYGSQQDVQNPGTTLTIYDDQGLFPRARDGAKGVAIYDGVADKYRAVYCEQVGITAKATLSSNLTGGSTASISGFTITSPTPFNLSPTSTPTSAANPHKHRGLSGATVWLAWDGSSAGEWVVVDIERVTAQFPLLYSGTGPLRLNANKLQGYMVDVAIELGATPSWVDLLDYTTECEEE